MKNLCEYKRKKTVLTDQNLVWFAGCNKVVHALDILETRGVKVTPMNQVTERQKQALKRRGIL